MIQFKKKLHLDDYVIELPKDVKVAKKDGQESALVDTEIALQEAGCKAEIAYIEEEMTLEDGVYFFQQISVNKFNDSSSLAGPTTIQALVRGGEITLISVNSANSRLVTDKAMIFDTPKQGSDFKRYMLNWLRDGKTIAFHEIETASYCLEAKSDSSDGVGIRGVNICKDSREIRMIDGEIKIR